MNAEELLRQLYDRSMVNNCTEYLDGLKKYPPDGYGDTSLKEWWGEAVKLITTAQKQARLDAIDECLNAVLGTVCDWGEGKRSCCATLQRAYENLKSLKSAE